MAEPRPSSSGPSPGTSVLSDVLDRVLDRGIVIDVEVRVSLIGLAIAGVDARIVVASIETYLEHADHVVGTFPVSWRWVGQTNLGSPRIPEWTGEMPRNRLRPFLDDQYDGPPFFEEEDQMTSAPAQEPRRTVLIVEDDEDSRFVYGAILEKHGFVVITALSGDDGLRIARERHPNAILMDVSVPGMDGWTVTSTLKGDPGTSGIPVIIITAHAFPEDQRRADRVGCDAFLTKPCDPRQVLDEVCRVVGA